MDIRFRQLEAFHAIMEAGTVTGAANNLGISQPGISNLLAQLERQTKLTLFHRVKGRLIPTPEAEVLFRETDTVVRGLDHVAQAVTDLQNNKSGQLQVASQHSISFGLMPRLIAKFARNRPDLSISFQSQYSSKVQEWVVAGLFEIGICEMPDLYDSLNYIPMQVGTLLAMNERNPLAIHDILTPNLLENEPFIVMGPGHMTHRATLDAFRDAGVQLNTRVHSHLFKNLLSFVKEDMGVSILDRFVLEHDREGGFVTRPFAPEITVDMAIVTSKTRPLSQIGQEFLTLLCAELDEFML